MTEVGGDVATRRPVDLRFGGQVPAPIWFGMVLTPLAVAAIALLGVAYHPTGDFALLELRTRDLGHEAVLVGPLSRDSWHHLGPTVYYLFYLPYHLTGEASQALLLTALVVNGACIVGMSMIARRHGGGTFFVATVIGCALLIRSFGAEFMLTPWNPTITVFPLGVLISLTWAMTCGSAWALPVAALTATFLVQTHVGYLALAVPLLLFGLVWLAVSSYRPSATSTRSPPSRRPLHRAAAAAAAVLVVLWLPPIIDELTNAPGNLEAVYDYFRSPPEDAHTIGDGLDVLSAQFAIDPPWITGERALNRFNEPAALDAPRLPVLAVAVVAAFGLLVARGPAASRRYAVTVGFALLLAIATIARTPGPLYMYRLDWLPVLGMMAALAVVLAVVSLVTARLPTSQLRRPATVFAAIVLTALTVASSVAATRFDVPGHQLSAAVADVAPAVHADIPPGDGEVVFHRGPHIIAGSVARGLELYLERRGVRTAAGGEHDVDTRPRAEYVVVVDQFVHAALDDPRYELVARTGPLDLRRLAPGEHTVAVLRVVTT